MGRGRGQCLEAVGTPTRRGWSMCLGWDGTGGWRACAVGCCVWVVLKVHRVPVLRYHAGSGYHTALQGQSWLLPPQELIPQVGTEVVAVWVV